MASHLPYHDTKPQGSPDFYFAVVATLRFVLGKLGHEGLVRYLRDMARDYFRPVNLAWTSGGLDEVAAYWKEFFAAEPGSEVDVSREENAVRVEIRTCPLISHHRRAGRAPLACLCQHCFYLNDARAETAGLAMRLEGGNGSCVHTYMPREGAPAQDLADIKEYVR